MSEAKKKHGAAGARNPKTHRITVSVAEHINKRLETVADLLGQNKGAMASMALSVGLMVLDPRKELLEVSGEEASEFLDGQVAELQQLK